MVTNSNKTTVTIKKTNSIVEKKPVTKKVVADTSKTSKATVTTVVKKVAAKPPIVKTALKVGVLPKTAPLDSKPANKPAIKKSVSKKSDSPVSPAQRYQMIATAAYFKAEHRGFAGGYEMQDWIAAEAEVDANLAA